MLRSALAIIALALALSQTACVSMSSLQTAETVPKGKTQTTAGGGYFSTTETATKSQVELQSAYFEASYREGLSENFDYGLKLTFIGSAQADLKYRLINGKGFNFSVGAGVGYTEISTGTGPNEIKNTIIDGIVPIYASYRFTDWFAFYVTPRYVYRTNTISGAQSGSASSSLAGGASGFKIGKEWGLYIEAAYQKQLEVEFDMMQYNVSLFWNGTGGLISSLF